MKLTYEQLFFDLLRAFYDAKKHKSTKNYVVEFEQDLTNNIHSLCDELYNKHYSHGNFTTFVAHCTQPREVFAAQFRDRIVNHLYFNYLHEYFESLFIADSYSCIKERGTSYGVQRLDHHIRSESLNFQKECYVLKIDIRAYFININRSILKQIVYRHISKLQQKHPEKLDYDLIYYLTDLIIDLDPTQNAHIKGSQKDWLQINPKKSLFHAKENCGLPIGDLTSQLFSNIYLNELDQYIKRVLKAKHYGRYVDDAYVVSTNRNYLRSIIPLIENFLKEHLLLEMHRGKTKIVNVKYGVEFLGAYIKPYRIYIATQSLKRMIRSIRTDTDSTRILQRQSSISKLGFLKQYKTYNIRKRIFYE